MRTAFRAGVLAVVPFLPGASEVNAARLPHVALRRSEPAEGDHLAVAPRRITLWFTERPEVAFTRMRLVGTAGAVQLAKVTGDTGNPIHADVLGALSSGTWRV